MTRVVNRKTGQEVIMPIPPYRAVQAALATCELMMPSLQYCDCLPVIDEGNVYRCGDWYAVKGTEQVAC